MKRAVFATMVVLSSVPAAQGLEIATVMGAPDASLSWVQTMVEKRIPIGNLPSYETTTATWAYSVFKNEGIRSAISIQFLDAEGSGNLADFVTGMRLAQQGGDPVVYSNSGPADSSGCEVMAEAADIAFVLPAGNGANAKAVPLSCLAGNILFVTAYNQTTGNLMSYANWGEEWVRVAGPAYQIPVIGPGGRTETAGGSTASSARVAARLAVYARIHPERHGSELVERFLSAETQVLPSLQGKVRDGRALR